ncbi:unnamed protein product [Amoebophrya sp. A25]|nr:unnamed protein product [Amoebophrya sp. A25]|eukprot:GSA25T00005767001.1
MNDVDRALFGGKDPDDIIIRHPFAAPRDDDGFAAPLPIPVGKAASPASKPEVTTKSTEAQPASSSGDLSKPELSGDSAPKKTPNAEVNSWHLEQAPDSEFRHEHTGSEVDQAKKMQDNFEKMQESMKSHFGNVIYHEDGRIENNEQVRYDTTGAAINPAFAAKANMTPNMFAINTLQLGAPLPPGMMMMMNDGVLLDSADSGTFGTPAAPPAGLKPASALYADNRSAIAPPNRGLDQQMFMSHMEWARTSAKGKGKKKGPGGDPDARVWIGGLPDDITEDRMRAKFGHFGMLVDIDIKYQPIEKGGGPPFAFLQYETFAEAQKVIEEMDQLRVFDEKNRIKVCGCSAAAKAAARQRTLERNAWEAKERAREKGLGQLEGEDGKVIEDDLDFKGKKGGGKGDGKGKGKAPRKGDGVFASGADGKKTAADLEAERVAARWKLLWEKEKKQKAEEEAFKRKERRRELGLPSTTPPRRPRSPRRSRSRGRRDDRRDDRGRDRRDYDRDRRYDDRRDDRDRNDRDRRDRGSDDYRGDRERRGGGDDDHRRDRDREMRHRDDGEQRGRDRGRDQDGGGDRERTRDRGDHHDDRHDDRVVLKENRRGGDDEGRGDRGRERERRRGAEDLE